VTIVSLAVLVSMNARLEQSQKVINIQSIRTLAQNVELVLTFVLLKQFTWDNRIVCMTHNKGILRGEFPYFFVLEEAWKNALAFELKCKYVLIKT
jgi:hypothetical protein